MRKIKYIIPILLLFLVIGFATVNYTLGIDGNTEITGDLADFKVYFSKILVNGIENNNAATSTTSLYLDGILEKVGNSYTVTYDVTNASKYFDAKVSINCTSSTDYLLVENTFDTSNLLALETRTGTLVLKKIKTIANTDSINNSVTCNINATPVEREEPGTGTIVSPLNPFYIGREVSIGTEKFNVISSTEDTVTMLAQYNIGSDYKQTKWEMWTSFSNSSGWESSPGPKEINIQSFDGETKDLLNNYIHQLKTTYNLDITGDLISLQELETLGCTIPADYAYGDGGWSCVNSPYSDWLLSNQNWWTRSAFYGNSEYIWSVYTDGSIYENWYDDSYSVRPTITISKEQAKHLLNVYPVGKEISIGNEKFNVISDNGTTISLLAKYNIGSDNKQSKENNYISFSDDVGWEYEPAPQKVDLEIWAPDVLEMINKYTGFLGNGIDGQEILGELITLEELKGLGCLLPDDYVWDMSSSWHCNDSPYKSWLINNQTWWTQTPGYTDGVWSLWDNGIFDNIAASDQFGVRPVITISKNYLQ